MPLALPVFWASLTLRGILPENGTLENCRLVRQSRFARKGRRLIRSTRALAKPVARSDSATRPQTNCVPFPLSPSATRPTITFLVRAVLLVPVGRGWLLKDR